MAVRNRIWFEMKKDLKELFRRISENGDRKAFSIFFQQYHVKLLQFALLYTPHYDQAEDMVSNVMVKLIRNAKKLHGVESVENFLFMSVKHEALNYLKHEKHHKIVVVDNDEEFFSSDFIDPHEKLVEKELRDVLRIAVEKLPRKRKIIYKLFKDERLKYKQIADLMDISERTVGTHITLSIREIRQALRAYLNHKSGKQRYMLPRKSSS